MDQSRAWIGPRKARPSRWLSLGWEGFVRDPVVFLVAGALGGALLWASGSLLLGPVSAALAAVSLRRGGALGVEGAPKDASWTQGELSAALRLFLPSLLSGFLVLLFSCLGLIFFLIPGLVIFSMYLFTFHFIVEKKLDFWEAMEASRTLVARDYLGFSLFALLLLLINLLGAAFFMVGWVVALPVSSLAVTAAYLECVRPAAGQAVAPPPQGPPIHID